jgi:hypothetical protein
MCRRWARAPSGVQGWQWARYADRAPTHPAHAQDVRGGCEVGLQVGDTGGGSKSIQDERAAGWGREATRVRYDRTRRGGDKRMVADNGQGRPSSDVGPPLRTQRPDKAAVSGKILYDLR